MASAQIIDLSANEINPNRDPRFSVGILITKLKNNEIFNNVLNKINLNGQDVVIEMARLAPTLNNVNFRLSQILTEIDPDLYINYISALEYSLLTSLGIIDRDTYEVVEGHEADAEQISNLVIELMS
jgi:hypothetical protein